MQMVMEGRWTDGSGKLANPEKSYFLRIACAAVREVNEQKDNEGMKFPGKEMVRTGMALNTNGLWEERQLFARLQNIINKHWNHFNGEPVVSGTGDIDVHDNSQ